ncbi:MAG: hypothetical protein ACREJ6_14630 [Candidatus Methylomirabilis sp.]
MPAIRQTLRFTCLGMCAFFFTSCIVSRHPAGIASSTAPVSSAYTVLGSVEETSCSYRVLFIPFGGKDPTDEMIERAVKQKGADALAGVTVEHSGSTFALPIVASDCTIVKGLAVKNVQ